ncbi:MAG: rod shape-determining protein [Oscillospiraceae bacterium]|jgi:rod shape-determining protein MreB|nr:rod shape-determining protein [Oscillospiraceae bacterium]
MVFFVERDIAVDLGTDTTLLYVSGKGIRLREPTIVAVDRQDGRLIKVGEDARKMLGRTPANIAAVHPISAGVISDYDMTAAMLKELIRRVTSFSLFKPRVLVCVPGGISGVEERAIMDAVIEAGGRKVYLVQSAVATAVGAGLDVNRPDGHMIIDIGGGTTEAAVVSLNGVVVSESIKTAGAAFDEAIIKYIRRKHNLLIGSRTAEDLKKSIGCIKERPEVSYEEVKGRCLMTGLPRSVTINSDEMVEALGETAETILETVHMVLERTPPELVADISENGIVLSGGGSLLYGMDRLVTERTGIPAHVVDDALSCTAYGAGRMLSRLDSMTDGMMNFARRRQLDTGVK